MLLQELHRFIIHCNSPLLISTCSTDVSDLRGGAPQTFSSSSFMSRMEKGICIALLISQFNSPFPLLPCILQQHFLAPRMCQACAGRGVVRQVPLTSVLTVRQTELYSFTCIGTLKEGARETG